MATPPGEEHDLPSDGAAFDDIIQDGGEEEPQRQ
jgi:hypothetical protein